MSPATPSGGRSCGSGPEENLEGPSHQSQIQKGSSVLITMNVSPVTHRTRSRRTTIVSNWIRQAIENDIARIVEAARARGSTSPSREFIGDITGIQLRAVARHCGIHLAVSTQHEEPA